MSSIRTAARGALAFGALLFAGISGAAAQRTVVVYCGVDEA
jgi:hypothetical protein